MAMTIETLLQTAEFLYRIEDQRMAIVDDPYTLASRLSFTIWKTMPDAWLMEHAAKGTLRTAVGLRKVVDEMYRDPRSHRSILEFFDRVFDINAELKVGHSHNFLRGLDKQTISSDVIEEWHNFLTRLIRENAPLKSIWLDNRVQIQSENIAKIYELEHKPEIQTLGQERSGVLSRAAFLLQPVDNTSYFHRGAWMRRHLICGDLLDPVGNDANNPPRVSPDMSTREQRKFQTESGSCYTCHIKINDLGFATGRYDTLGRYQLTESRYYGARIEGPFPVDSSGFPKITFDDESRVEGLHDLSVLFSESDVVATCLSKQYFRSIFRRHERGKDRCYLDKVFADKDHQNIPLIDFFKKFVIEPKFSGLK